jgi:hypothetical protein
LETLEFVMMFEKIDRHFMELMNRFDKEVSAFHAFRSLWASLVANREDCGLSRDSLEMHQARQITEVLNIAEQMRDHVGLKWCFSLSRDAENGLYFAQDPKADGLHVFRLTDGVMYSNDGEFGAMRDLINAGWRFDGPVRTAVFE